MKRHKLHLARQALTYFGATIVSAALSVALLPFATSVLGPSDFGAYGYVIAMTSLAASLADLGVGIVLTENYNDANESERRHLIMTLMATSFTAASVLAVLIFIAWPFLAALAGEMTIVAPASVFLACATLPLRALIAISTTTFILQSRSSAAGAAILVQALVSFGMTLVALFIFELHLTSLFVGNAVGVFCGTALSIAFLSNQLTVKPQKRWLKAIIKVAPSALSSGLLDSIRPVAENASLVRADGLHALGIYSHARMYYSFLMQAVNAIAYALWPKSLEEGRNPNGDFTQIGRAWRCVYLALTLIGIGFSAFGKEIINLLTNDKFGEAAFWAPFWIAYLLLQNSGKAATAIMYAAKNGAKVARYRAVTVLCALPFIVAIVPFAGTSALVLIAFAEMLAFRLLLQRAARRYRKLPFQDGWVLIGNIAIISLTTFTYNLDLFTRAAFFASTFAILLIAGRAIVSDGVAQFRSFMLSKASEKKSNGT